MIEMLIEFLLFGTVEVFILLMFYKMVGGFKNVKYWHGILLCPIFYMFGLVPFPFVKQISMMIIMAIYLLVVSKETVKGAIKTVILGFLYLLIVEATSCIIIGSAFGFDINGSTLERFFCLTPTRLIEFSLLIIYDRIGAIKLWGGYGFPKLKKSKMKKKK